MNANKQIRLKKLEVPNWQTKITPAIERIAELLINTDGQSSRPPLLKSGGEAGTSQNEVYEIQNENDPVLIAAKLAETKGLRRLSVLIEENLTDSFLEMENLLNGSQATQKKVAKPRVTKKTIARKKAVQELQFGEPATKKATPKKVTKPETFQELQFD